MFTSLPTIYKYHMFSTLQTVQNSAFSLHHKEAEQLNKDDKNVKNIDHLSKPRLTGGNNNNAKENVHGATVRLGYYNHHRGQLSQCKFENKVFRI